MNIGFIGLGLMGSAMCTNLAKKRNEEVVAYDVNLEVLQNMTGQGVIAAGSIKEVAERCSVIVTMVPKNEHVIAVYKELLPNIKKDTLLIEMSTISPEVSRQLAERVRSVGSDMVDAPVVKSRPAALAGTLGIYVGGTEEGYLRAKPYLECMGCNIIHLGPNGSGLVMKLCHNALVAQIQNGVNETLILAQRAGGITPDVFAKAISYGGGQNFYLDSKAEVIAKHDFTTAFSVENMNKDVHLANEIAKSTGSVLEGIGLTCRRYEDAMEKGYGKEDFSATYKLFEEAQPK